MGPFHILETANWQSEFTSNQQASALQALEKGQVLFFPHLSCPMTSSDKRFLSPSVLGGGKNVSYDPSKGAVSGTSCSGTDAIELADLMSGFAARATGLIQRLLPSYCRGLRRGRTSFRPIEVEGRSQSWRKDDTRLHVDSFPSQPTRGKRILRMFSNVNPDGKPRRWRIGESFAAVAGRFWPKLRSPIPGSSLLLRLLNVTKTQRTTYDHYMLQLHDAMKADMNYQRSVDQVVYDFPAGSTWACFTDQVSHAALAGQHQFEQTFRLSVKQMCDQQTAPLRVLERMAGRMLV